jgi:hypothetical protein
MKLKINKKEYTLHMGLAFIRELDRRYTQNFAGVEFGHGVAKVFLGLTQYNPVALSDLILAATVTLDEQPSLEDIEKEMMSWDEKEVVKNYNVFLDALGENSLTRAQVGQIAITQLTLEARQMQEREEEKKLQRGRIES